jgi:hypothetical protein
MAVATAIAPLALAVAIRTKPNAPSSGLLVIAGLLWLLAVVTYRAFARAHERWRRKMLRHEIAAARKARLDSSEAFQDRLKEQSAILERMVTISDTVLSEGIVDPARVLENIRLVNAHSHEAQGLIADAIAEVRVETGSQTFDMQAVDVRSEIEHVAAPFIRSDREITTSGTQHFAETDPAVFRVIIRGLIARANELGAESVDVSVARDGALVVCTVADDGPDRAATGLDDLPPLATSLASGVDGEFDFSRAFGWNQYCISLPVGVPPTRMQAQGAPLDVLGTVRPSRPTSKPSVASPDAASSEPTEPVMFAGPAAGDRGQTVAARRKTPVAAR